MSTHHQPAAMPGLVTAHTVAVGDEVRAGDVVAIVETMKCESPVTAEVSGRVGWLAQVGSAVAVGDDVVQVIVRDAVRPPAPDDIVDLLLGETAEPRLAPLTREAAFVELDLDAEFGPGSVRGGPDRLVQVPRRRKERDAGVVVGLVAHRLDPHDRPVRRVWLCGDATRSLGAVAEPECRRIIAAIDLAEELGVPLEWVAVSSGARISMSSGTENMDWCAAVVRRLVEFTQGGGEVVIVVAGINVGAQSYWNAEATMLMHCAGMLVMVEGTAMVLTGSRSLARAGGVSERNDHDLGGTGVMVPNGEVHHRAEDLVEALRIVLVHHSLCAHGREHRLSRAPTVDTVHRDICEEPMGGLSGAGTIGDVLCGDSNPSRTRPFDIEPLMAAVADHDAPRLSRWDGMEGASGALVWDTRIDGWPVSLIGIDSRPREVDGRWEAAGTLYPMASRKIARALNHASGRRPAVVLANLAGFDGSRESLWRCQLEHGAELARAVVNFRGPLVVVVVGRFHGGAYVVLNRRLNPELRIVALEGTRVSVIGGSSAAEVVLRREVTAHMAESGLDPDDPEHRREAVAEVARTFDRVHDVHRAAAVGSVDTVVEPSHLRASVASMITAPQEDRGSPELPGTVGGDRAEEAAVSPRSPERRLAGMTAAPA